MYLKSEFEVIDENGRELKVSLKDINDVTDKAKTFITDVLKEERNKPLKVKFKKLREDAVMPTYAKDGDYGMDVTAISVEYDKEKDCFVYHLGWAVEVPKGYVMKLYPRSSNRKTDAYMTNHVGIIDSGYRGEVLVCFKNRDSLGTILSKFRTDKFIQDTANGNVQDIKAHAYAVILTSNNIVNNDKEFNKFMMSFAPYKVGDRVAQIAIEPYPIIEGEWADELSESERGTNGHGSTGR